MWAMEPRALHALALSLARGEAPNASSQQRQPKTYDGSVAVVPVLGPLVRRGSFLSRMFGFTSYDDIKANLANALADKSVGRILLVIDSPGGDAVELELVSAAVRDAGRIKPISAFATGMMASAAYSIGASVGPGNVTAAARSTQVGSVGAVMLHGDYSAALATEGLKITTLVSSISPQKAEFSPYAPLSPEARQNAQRQLDAIASQFVTDLVKGRGVSAATIKAEFGKGALLRADEALSKNMIDRIGSVAAAISGSGQSASRLSGAVQPSGPAAARARRLQLLKIS